MKPDTQHALLLVDDEPAIIRSLQRLFRKENYRILSAASGPEALEVMRTEKASLSLIISDQRMPEMSGSQFLEEAKALAPEAVRFLLTGHSDMEAVIHAVNKGEIHRYLTKPWNDDDLLLQVRQAVQQLDLKRDNDRLTALIAEKNQALSALNRDLEKRVRDRTREIEEKNTALADANTQLEKSFMGTVRMLSSLVDNLSPDLGRYMRHVAQLARSVAEDFGEDKTVQDTVEIAGLFHDIALMGFPDCITEKPEDRLNPEEFKTFSQHPVLAAVSFESVDRLSDVSELILYHHENFDGSGFPNGLRGTDIPLGARILRSVSSYCRVVDTWPKETRKILDKARRHIGTAATKHLSVDNPEIMLREVGETLLLAGTHQVFDPEVVSRIMKVVRSDAPGNQGKKAMLLFLKDLRPGMLLANDLRIKDGRLLLTKGAELSQKTIDAICNIGERGMLDEQIRVLVEEE